MSVSIRELCDVKKCAKRLDNSEKQRKNIEDNLHRILKATNGIKDNIKIGIFNFLN